MAKNRNANFQLGTSGREPGTESITLKIRIKGKGKRKSSTEATQIRCKPGETGVCKRVKEEIREINRKLHSELESDEEVKKISAASAKRAERRAKAKKASK